MSHAPKMVSASNNDQTVRAAAKAVKNFFLRSLNKNDNLLPRKRRKDVTSRARQTAIAQSVEWLPATHNSRTCTCSRRYYCLLYYLLYTASWNSNSVPVKGTSTVLDRDQHLINNWMTPGRIDWNVWSRQHASNGLPAVACRKIAVQVFAIAAGKR